MSDRTLVSRLLSLRHPVLLAPMDLVANARLTAAVSAGGGLGILGGGYGNAEWLSGELDALQSSGQRFGVGFITWSLARQPHFLDLALERKPVAIMLSFGDPQAFVDRIKRAGARVICQVQTLAGAKQAAAAGADVLVAQGTEGGGHGGSRGLMTLLPEMADEIDPKVALVAAGGIADGRGLAAATVLGASGVLIGTRFYASAEAGGADAAKLRICAATGDDTARSIVFDISRRNVWPAPFTGRCLRNTHLARWLGREVELMQHVDEESAHYLAARESGDFDIAAVIAGEASGLVREVLPAATIIDRMVRDADALLTGRSPSATQAAA